MKKFSMWRVDRRRCRACLLIGVVALATAHAQARLLADPGELTGTPVVVGFDILGSPDAAQGRVAVGGLPGVGLGVRAVNGDLRAGPGTAFGAATGATDWQLGSNGQWSASRSFVAVNGTANTQANIYAGLIFDFGGMAVSEVGAMVNFNPDFIYGAGFALPLYLAAYDASGQLLDSHEVQVTTPGATDQGRFYGIAVASASIARFEVTGPYAAVDDWTFTTPVPDAPAWLLALVGTALLARGRQFGVSKLLTGRPTAL